MHKEIGIVSTFYHLDTDGHGGTKTASDRPVSHNRYFYEVWEEFIRHELGAGIPVVIVDNASPVHPRNFFSHFKNFEIINNTEPMMPQGSRIAHSFNFRSALWCGMKRLGRRGVRYAAHVEQDVLVRGRRWLQNGVRLLKRTKKDIMGFELVDTGRFSTELFITNVNFWLRNRLLNPELFPRQDALLYTEYLLSGHLRLIDAPVCWWPGMKSTRDVHPDPLKVNGVKYMHHRHAPEVIKFLENGVIKSVHVDRLKRFIRSHCDFPK